MLTSPLFSLCFYYRIYSPETNSRPGLPSDNVLAVDPPFDGKARFQRLFSPMYNSLHTNLPKNVMQYRDFDFAPDAPQFPSHSDVLAYLHRFTAENELFPLIRFDTSVAEATYDDAQQQWTLTLATRDGGAYTATFDALIVANGHYSIPYIPPVTNIEALDTSGVHWMHSREYRRPDAFKDQTVFVVGSGSSGLDIVRESSRVASKVYHSVRSENKQSRQEQALSRANVERVGLLEGVQADGTLELSDGTTLKVDHVVFATGFHFSFPFLGASEKALVHKGETVCDVYRFLFNVGNPTLAFMALPIRIVPFPLAQTQATVIARVWNAKNTRVALPSRDAMQAWYAAHPTTQHEALVFTSDIEFDYVDRMACWAAGYDYDDADDRARWQQANASVTLTAPLSNEWKQNRLNALAQRKEYLGY
ncbi:hypothetical protein BC940DRAFT_289943 [Gongronella butleri]|nr:hypothetical protein BC940DRAFT_289943 [Gongronella butleri]